MRHTMPMETARNLQAAIDRAIRAMRTVPSISASTVAAKALELEPSLASVPPDELHRAAGERLAQLFDPVVRA